MFPPAHWPATTVLRRLMSVLLPLHENYAISRVYFRHRTPRIDYLAQYTKPSRAARIYTAHIIYSERYWHYIRSIFTNTPFPKMTTSFIVSTYSTTPFCTLITRLNTQSLDSQKTMSNPVNSNGRNRTSISDETSQRTVYLNRLPLCYVAF